jgi:hypothetical protein
MPERIGDGIRDILSRLLVGAPRTAVGKPVIELLEHPLLRLAREYYPGKKSELEMALRFFRERLSSCGVSSENDCPVSDVDLTGWVAGGLEYGQWVAPALVSEIFRAYEPNDLRNTLTWLRALVSKAGGTQPLQLMPALKEWQQRTFGWTEPQCYGEELARVVYFSDFAIWISFALSGAAV